MTEPCYLKETRHRPPAFFIIYYYYFLFFTAINFFFVSFFFPWVFIEAIHYAALALQWPIINDFVAIHWWHFGFWRFLHRNFFQPLLISGRNQLFNLRCFYDSVALLWHSFYVDGSCFWNCVTSHHNRSVTNGCINVNCSSTDLVWSLLSSCI